MVSEPELQREGWWEPLSPPSTPGVPPCPRLLLLAGAAGPQGSRHSLSVHQAAAAAPRTGASGVPRPPAPAPRLPLQHSTPMGAQCWLAPAAPAALCPLAPTCAGKGGVTAQPLPCCHLNKEPLFHLILAGTSSPQGQGVMVHPAGIELCTGTQRHLPWGHGAQQGARGLLPRSPSPSRTSARNVAAAAGSALMAMGLKGWPGSMLCRVTLGLPLTLLQDTVTSATRVPGTASSLRATMRGRSGRAGGRPRDQPRTQPVPPTARPAVLRQLCSCTQALTRARVSLPGAVGPRAPHSYLLL